jgi:hypothetical protein
VSNDYAIALSKHTLLLYFLLLNLENKVVKYENLGGNLSEYLSEIWRKTRTEIGTIIEVKN